MILDNSFLSYNGRENKCYGSMCILFGFDLQICYMRGKIENFFLGILLLLFQDDGYL